MSETSRLPGDPLGLKSNRPGQHRPVIRDEQMFSAVRFLTIVYDLAKVYSTKQFQDTFDATFESQYRKDMLSIMKSYCNPKYLNILERIRA